MDRTRLILISALVTAAAFVGGGCASRPSEADRVYGPRPDVFVAKAPVLAFDPAIAVYGPQLDLSREGRGQAAFVGFDSVTTYSFTRMDDRQSFYGSAGAGRYRGSNSAVERQAVTQTVGVRER